MKNSEIAEGAIEVLEKDGWIKHSYRTSDGYCLLGAGMRAMGQFSLINVDQVLEAFYPRNPGSIPIHLFNDDQLTNYDDVINFLTETAKYWRDRGE